MAEYYKRWAVIKRGLVFPRPLTPAPRHGVAVVATCLVGVVAKRVRRALTADKAKRIADLEMEAAEAASKNNTRRLYAIARTSSGRAPAPAASLQRQ
eukprot:8828909-Alexandrium_andersonii.AAC.1